MAKTIKLCKMY